MKPGATFRTDDAKKLTRCGFAHLHIACYVSALVLTKVTTLNKLKVKVISFQQRPKAQQSCSKNESYYYFGGTLKL